MFQMTKSSRCRPFFDGGLMFSERNHVLLPECGGSARLESESLGWFVGVSDLWDSRHTARA
jgi:hypothetical protein